MSPRHLTCPWRRPQTDSGDAVAATKEPWALCPGPSAVRAGSGPLCVHGQVRPGARTHLPPLGSLQSPRDFGTWFPSRTVAAGSFYTSALRPALPGASLVNSSKKWGSFSKEEAGSLGGDRSVGRQPGDSKAGELSGVRSGST